MSARTKQNGPKEGGTYRAKMSARWNNAAPDWVVALTKALDAEVAGGGSQASLGKRIGIRADMISGVIGKSYAGNYGAVEQIVRGALMSEKVRCPALSDVIGRDECVAYQSRKLFTAANPQLVKLKAQCPRCPNKVSS